MQIGTSSIDRFMLGDRLNEVTADTGSIVLAENNSELYYPKILKIAHLFETKLFKQLVSKPTYV